MNDLSDSLSSRFSSRKITSITITREGRSGWVGHVISSINGKVPSKYDSDIASTFRAKTLQGLLLQLASSHTT